MIGFLLLAIFTFSTGSFSHGEIVGPLRVHLAARLPIDPLYLKSMAEYDLSLMLWRAWFAYDKGRRADHGSVKTWSFDDKIGEYKFTVDDLKWSDGSELTADHLIKNLQRISKSGTAYAKSLNSIVDIQSLRQVDAHSLVFKTVTGKPSDPLFNQLGSVFFSILHPDDFGADGHRVKQNTRTLGPYKLVNSDKEQMVFEKNSFFKQTNPAAPTQVIVRPNDLAFSVESFLKNETWCNYFQTNTLLKTETAKAVLAAKLPIWTRGFDRVALLKPLGAGQALKHNRAAIQTLGAAALRAPKFVHPLQVSLARSLQPFGYPLFKEIEYEDPRKEHGKLKIKILSYQVPQLELIQPWLNAEIATKGGYLPLFHGATVSMGKPGMSFELVDPLDETVDYSKVKIAN